MPVPRKSGQLLQGGSPKIAKYALSAPESGAMMANGKPYPMPSRIVQLEQAREHVRHARQRIEDQTALISRLQPDGHGTEAAEQLLATFIDLMTKLTLHRDLLEEEAEHRAGNSDPGG
jgi:hypothetical protein